MAGEQAQWQNHLWHPLDTVSWSEEIFSKHLLEEGGKPEDLQTNNFVMVISPSPADRGLHAAFQGQPIHSPEPGKGWLGTIRPHILCYGGDGFQAEAKTIAALQRKTLPISFPPLDGSERQIDINKWCPKFRAAIEQAKNCRDNPSTMPVVNSIWILSREASRPLIRSPILSRILQHKKKGLDLKGSWAMSLHGECEQANDDPFLQVRQACGAKLLQANLQLRDSLLKAVPERRKGHWIFSMSVKVFEKPYHIRYLCWASSSSELMQKEVHPKEVRGDRLAFEVYSDVQLHHQDHPHHCSHHRHQVLCHAHQLSFHQLHHLISTYVQATGNSFNRIGGKQRLENARKFSLHYWILSNTNTNYGIQLAPRFARRSVTLHCANSSGSPRDAKRCCVWNVKIEAAKPGLVESHFLIELGGCLPPGEEREGR